MSTLTAILAAAIPTVFYALLLWWLDRYEKEPLPLLLVAFLWGAIPAIALAVLFELVLAVPLERSPVGPDVASWGVAPVVEEVLKALAVAGLFRWARREFDGPLDGIVYGALIGFGFAMTENALYFMRADDVGALFWVRGVLFGMNHALFTALVGLALGAVRYRHDARSRLAAFAGGLALAILFHAAHNLLVGRFAALGVFFSWVVQSGGVVVVVAVAVLSWRHERTWIEHELRDEVRRGLLSAPDYGTVVSSTRRARAELQALLRGGVVRFRCVRRLHHLLTELAFAKSQLQLADHRLPEDEPDRLRREIVALRARMAKAGDLWESETSL